MPLPRSPAPDRWARILLLLAAVALLGACSRPQPAAEPVRAVKLVTVTMGPLQSGYEFAGEVRPRVESRLGFRVAGKMVRRHVEAGQRVKAGQLLAQIDPQDYRLAADAARAQVAAARTNQELAAADYKRYAALKDQNFISGAELERRESALKAAQAQLEQAQAQLSSQGNQASYTSLVADVAGVVTAVEAEPGQVVAAGAPVVRIAQDGPRDVVFSVPEDKLAAMRPGGVVKVRAWAANMETVGRVREVAASADPVTRTYQIKVGLEAKDALPLGSTVYLVPEALTHVGAQAIKLPTSALRQDGRSTAVWVLDTTSMTVRSQPVQVATADGNEAVIAAGLHPGMRVVVAGVHVLSPGQKVTVYQPREATAVSAQAPAEAVGVRMPAASQPAAGAASAAK